MFEKLKDKKEKIDFIIKVILETIIIENLKLLKYEQMSPLHYK